MENSIENLFEKFKKIQKEDFLKFMEEDINLNDLNSTFKVLHQLENLTPELIQEITKVRDSINELFYKDISSQIRKNEHSNFLISNEINKYHQNIRKNRK